MKKNNKVLTVTLIIALIFGMAGSTATFAATDPGLGAAATFSIIAQTAITGTGTISGDVGLNSTGAGITALTAESVGGTIYSTDGVAPGLAIINPAVQADLSTANGNLSSQASTASIGPALDGLVLTPGVYDIGAGQLNGGSLTLNGQGIYILRASSELTSSGSVILTNGARACDVYWQVNSLATISSGSFAGTIIAGTGIHFGAGATLDGRALALGGDVTLINNNISGPTCAAPSVPPSASATLHIVKTVVNDNGGTAVAADFTINASGTNVSSSSFAGSESGTDITLDAGSYEITEPIVPAGYLESGSGDCSGTIAAGETKTCTITNDDVAPQLIVNKIVVNDNSGTKVISDFPLFIDGNSVASGVANTIATGSHTVSETSGSGYTAIISGDCAADGTIALALGEVKTCTITNNDIAPVASSPSGGGSYSAPVPPLIDVLKVPSPLALPNGSGTVKYTYTLRNIGTVSVGNVTMAGDTCSPITLISGDTNGNAKLDVNEIWTYTCSATLSKTHTNIVTATGWANGISATDIASATVVVGVPVVPPLIHVTKVPNPLVLSAGGGMVTYTNKVTNPGTVALSNIRLTDDKCSPVKYISGDTNGDSKLDTTETWTYVCQTKITSTTVNTVSASGDANGLTARDFAIATVVATAVPKLPNTGLSSGKDNTPWNIIIPAGILTILTSLCLVRRRQTN
ncbi:MAG: ice-binding family protein [Minisyncoccales bacterium]